MFTMHVGYLLTLFVVHSSWASQHDQVHIRSAIETEASKYLDPATNIRNASGDPTTFKDVYKWDARDYPQLPDGVGKTECVMNNVNEVYVCNPGELIPKEDAIKLNDKIKQIRDKTKCQCGSCSGRNGTYNIGIAISKDIVSDFINHCATDRVRVFATELRNVRWKSWIDSCNESMVIGLSDGGNKAGQGSVFTSTGPKIRSKISDDCVNKIFSNVADYFRNRDYYTGLDEMLTYYENALTGGKCGKRSGGVALSTGEIIGIVFGCIAGVILIVVLVIVIKNKCCDGE